MTASSTAPAVQVPLISAVTPAIDEAVDEVDPAVGVPHEPVGVHGPRHDLAGRRGREPVLPGLARA